MSKITPVIMSGGAGTRLWPLSRKAKPKQYHPLVTDRSLFDETMARVAGHGGEVVIVCARSDGGRLATAAPGATIVTEPMGRNTAPVAIIASLHVAKDDPEGLVLLLPADHHVRNEPGFREAVERGRAAAERGYLVTLGIKPTAPETGYGYIRRGAALTPDTYEVAEFVEKPDEETAKAYLADGGYAWNAGIFLFRARDLLEEAQKHSPDMVAQARKAYDRAQRDGDMLHLDEASFGQVPADSIDYAIMERTKRAAVVDPVEIGWDDIGAWSAVAALSLEAGEPHHDQVVLIDSKGSYARSDGPLVATVGVDDVIVVATKDAVLVVHKDRAQDVKQVIEELRARGREDLL